MIDAYDSGIISVSPSYRERSIRTIVSLTITAYIRNQKQMRHPEEDTSLFVPGKGIKEIKEVSAFFSIKQLRECKRRTFTDIEDIQGYIKSTNEIVVCWRPRT